MWTSPKNESAELTHGALKLIQYFEVIVSESKGVIITVPALI
jgi:hypothetical protein